MAFIDDDCQADPHWLRQLSHTLAEDEQALVGGSTPAPPSANIYDQVSQFILRLVYCHYNRVPHHSRFFACNNMALSALVFREIGGFHHQKSAFVSEDRILCDQLLSLGKPLIWNEQAVVYHQPELTLGKFCRLYFHYGRGAFLYQKNRQKGNASDELRFYLRLPLLIGQELRTNPDLKPIPTLLLLTLWQVFNLFGFVTQTIQVAVHHSLPER